MEHKNIVRGYFARIKHRVRRIFAAVVTLIVSAAPIQSVSAATTTIRVHRDNGSANPSELGDGWGNDHAYRFLQDALARAEDIITNNPGDDVVI